MSQFFKVSTNEIVNDIKTMSCPSKVNSNTIELTVHTPCYCILDLQSQFQSKYEV